MFKLASFSSKGHSPAEKFLFKYCLMNEIQQLNEGFAISINGKSYLIQCRIIQFVFDTKEVEHQLNVQCINAHAGCPFCHGTYGINIDCMKNKMAISDERQRLDLKHALRLHGQTCNCCLPDDSSDNFYYTNRKQGGNDKNYSLSDCEREDNLPYNKKAKIKQKRIPVPATELELLKPRVAQDMLLELVPFYFEVCDKINAKKIKKFVFFSNEPATWCHNQVHYPPEIYTLSKFIFYRTCNFKPHLPLTRKDNEFHISRANLLNDQRKRKVAKKYTKHLDGVKDHFYGFDSKYVSFEKHINFDPAHAITNCFNY
jgi:hypothetical protein